MKTVMLTGASGFIGNHCIPLLLKHGYEVHALTSGKTPQSDRRVSWHSVNLLEPDQVHNAIESICPTHLLHFAWYTKPGLYWSAKENIQWLQASLNLVQEFSAVGGKRIVSAGTCAEYDWRFGYCSEDVTPLKPQTLYGISKQSFQIIAQEILKSADISNAWGRIFFLYGPYENQSRLVPSIINALLPAATCTLHCRRPDQGLFIRRRCCRRLREFTRFPGYRTGKYCFRKAGIDTGDYRADRDKNRS